MSNTDSPEASVEAPADKPVAADLRASIDNLRAAVELERANIAAREAGLNNDYAVSQLQREEDRLMAELADLQGVKREDVVVPVVPPTPGFTSIEQAAENERLAAERRAANAAPAADPIVIERPVDPATLPVGPDGEVVDATVTVVGDVVPVEEAKKDLLKAAAADAGLPVSGDKATLVDRLHDAGVDSVATGDTTPTSRPGR